MRMQCMMYRIIRYPDYLSAEDITDTAEYYEYDKHELIEFLKSEIYGMDL